MRINPESEDSTSHVGDAASHQSIGGSNWMGKGGVGRRAVEGMADCNVEEWGYKAARSRGCEMDRRGQKRWKRQRSGF